MKVSNNIANYQHGWYAELHSSVGVAGTIFASACSVAEMQLARVCGI